jgi:hypothetical protein
MTASDAATTDCSSPIPRGKWSINPFPMEITATTRSVTVTSGIVSANPENLEEP